MKQTLLIRWYPAVRVLSWILAMGLCVTAAASSVLSQTGQIDLYVTEQTLSASIRSAPLRDVIAKIEDELGIWVQGAQHAGDETVTVEFESMPLEEGLDRILSSTNYSLVFDERGDLLGVILLSSASAPTIQRSRRTVTPRALPTVPRRTLPRSQAQ